MRRKEIIVCILALIILGVSVTNVFATNQPVIGLNSMNNDPVSLNSILESSSNTSEINNVSNSQNTIQSTNNINTVNSTNNTNTNTPNQLANTGLEETSFIAIAVCVLSAVFAYSKIKKYNF